MTSNEKMIKRATTMVAWFESLPDHATMKTDNEQALELHHISPTDGWVHIGAIFGNSTLVRSVRAWVDHQTKGEFAKYSFGTKRSGTSRTYTHMYDESARLMSATIGTTSQVQAAEQHERRIGEEVGRIVLKFNAESEEWFQLQDYQRSMVCRDAANDFEQFGRLKPATKQALARLGLIS